MLAVEGWPVSAVLRGEQGKRVCGLGSAVK